MQWSGRRMRVLWLAAFAALVGNTALSSYNVNVLVRNDELVTRTRVVKQELADLLADVVNAETGHRGFQITGEERYLEPYNGGLNRLPLRQQALRAAFAGDPEQAAKLDALDAAVAAKVGEMARSLAVHRAAGKAAGQAAVATGPGKGLMNDVRAQVRSLDAREDERLAEQSDVAAAKYRATTVTNLAGGALTLGVTALAYSAVRAELERRRRAEAGARLAALALADSQKSTAEALAQLDALFDHAPIGAAFYDADLRYRRVNRVLAAANRVPAADHLGKRTEDVLPDFPADLARDCQAVVDTGRPVLNRVVRYDAGAAGGGATAWEVSLFPVRGADGAALGLGVFAQDVTVREAAQDKLRDSEDRFRTLADAVPDFIWVTRPDGFHEYYNSRWYEYTGLTPAECLGHGWSDPLHPDDADRSRARWRHSLVTGEPYEIEYRLRSAAGAYRWFIGRARPVRDGATGAVVRWFGTCTDIDDQKRLEGEVRENARRFTTLAAAVPGFLFTLTADGVPEFVNDRFVEYTGVGRHGLGHAEWLALVHPDDRPGTEAAFFASMATGAELRTENRVRRHDGAYRWFAARALAVTDDAGRVQGWHGVAVDVDDQRRLADELAAGERRFRTLAQAVPGFVWSTGPDGGLDYLNPQVEEYTGRPLADTLATGWDGLMHPADRRRVLAAWAASTAAGRDYQAEFRLRRHDGVYRWFLAQALPARGADGAAEKWFGVTIDVDDFKQVTVRSETNAERFRLLTESIPQMVWNADAAGRVTYFNSRWREYTGLDAADPAGWWGRALHPDDAAVVEPEWRAGLAAAPDRLAWEARVRDAGAGDYRWLALPLRPPPPPGRPRHQWIGSLSDIDDQKRQAERLERMVKDQTAALVETNDALRGEVADRERAEHRERAAAAELRRSNAELEKFAYVASHDLQEPLRKIQAFGDRLNRKFRADLGPQGQDYIDRMQSSAGRMRVLIDDLLTFSRVATRTTPFAPVDLAAVVRDALVNLEVRLAESAGRVDVGPLPAVPADASQMRQLFQNLLGNALKFARPGVPPVVTVTAAPTAELPPAADPPAMAAGWRVTVADNGIGFEQQYAERIFDVFQRLHGRGDYEGTGIGLAICRKIVERHGGGVTARGVPGVGAAFILDLPAAAVYGPPGGAPSTPDPGA